MFKLDDISESEVALDSLGLLFNNLIDTDYCQKHMGASQAVEEEVTICQDRIVAKTETSTGNPKSKVFTPFGLFGSSFSFEKTTT